MPVPIHCWLVSLEVMLTIVRLARDMPGVHNSGSVAEEQAQDMYSVDLYDDGDDM